MSNNNNNNYNNISIQINNELLSNDEISLDEKNEFSETIDYTEHLEEECDINENENGNKDNEKFLYSNTLHIDNLKLNSSFSTPTSITTGFLNNKVLSLSTNSIKSLIPNFYSIKSANNSSSSFNQDNLSSKDNLLLQDQINIVSDELARESDVTVSTNITPQAEYKGFASYVISCIFLFIWICWSFLPDRILNNLGVYYYPNRWWALAIPSYVIVLMMYMYIAIALYDIEILTLPLNDNRNIVDDSGIIITQLKNFKSNEINNYLINSSSGVWDLPISIVNNVLYLNSNDNNNNNNDKLDD